MRTKVVIVEPGKPNPEIIALIKLPLWEKRVVYLRGSLMVRKISKKFLLCPIKIEP